MVAEHAECREEELTRPVHVYVIPAPDTGVEDAARLLKDGVLQLLVHVTDLVRVAEEDAEEVEEAAVAVLILAELLQLLLSLSLFFAHFLPPDAEAVVQDLHEAFNYLDDVILLVDLKAACEWVLLLRRVILLQFIVLVVSVSDV